MLPITSSNIHLSMSWTSENDNEATSIELYQLYFIFITWFMCELKTIQADWLWSATECFRCHFSSNNCVARKAKKKRANELNWIELSPKANMIRWTLNMRNYCKTNAKKGQKLLSFFGALVCSVILLTSDTAGYSRLTIHFYRCCSNRWCCKHSSFGILTRNRSVCTPLMPPLLLLLHDIGDVLINTLDWLTCMAREESDGEILKQLLLFPLNDDVVVVTVAHSLCPWCAK